MQKPTIATTGMTVHVIVATSENGSIVNHETEGWRADAKTREAMAPVKEWDASGQEAPDLVTASARGGVFSLIAVVLMAFMFITETYVFLGAGPVREVIDLEMDVSAELQSVVASPVA